jgi:hypothetical protein
MSIFLACLPHKIELTPIRFILGGRIHSRQLDSSNDNYLLIQKDTPSKQTFASALIACKAKGR